MAALVVLKFGGTSLATAARVRRAAKRVRAHVRAGRRVLVVVSANGDATDHILRRLRAVAPRVGPHTGREYDRALATGEDLSGALLSAALLSLGVAARSLRGAEAGLSARGSFGSGVLDALDCAVLAELLERGVVPVVSGFQASRADGETVTIGRNGSDATAVFLAGQLRAEACHIITDVEAVCDRDPREHADAKALPTLTHDALVRITDAGGEVVQRAAAHFAQQFGTRLHIYHFSAPFRPQGTAVGDLQPISRAS